MQSTPHTAKATPETQSESAYRSEKMSDLLRNSVATIPTHCKPLPDENHPRASTPSSNPRVQSVLRSESRSIAFLDRQSAEITMYIQRHILGQILTLLLLITLTLGYPPRYARRRHQFARPWLEPPGCDASTISQPSQSEVVAIDTGARPCGMVELVVKTVVATIVVTAQNSSHEEGSEYG